MPKSRQAKPSTAARPESEQDVPEQDVPEQDAGGAGTKAAGPEPEQAKAGCCGRRDRASGDFCGGHGFCGRHGAQASLSDAAAALLNQAMLMAGCASISAMAAANQADALMFYNAVANQQKTNILGTAVTAQCARLLLRTDTTGGDDFDVVEQALGKE
jgi:hypothetical protein